MARINYCFVICALLTVSAFADLNVPPEPIPSPTPVPTTEPPNSTTTPPPTPPTTKPTSTTPSTTPKPTPPTPTPKPTPPPTPTPKPTTPPTPTPKPTTPPTPTPKPTTPPTPKPTPPPTPKPTPPTPTPVPGTWHIDYPFTNISCILLKMAAIIEFTYNTGNNTAQEGQLIIWENANATGTCGNTSQIINLNWAAVRNGTDKSQTISLTFNKNGTKFELAEIRINITLDKTTFPDAKEPYKVLIHAKDDFVTPLKNSYKCDKLQTLNLTESKNVTAQVTQSTIKISDLQFEAFHNVTDAKTFAEAIDCEPYETPDIVPIAVGCALAALIVIVLITYLIGRRRNQARGYLSM